MNINSIIESNLTIVGSNLTITESIIWTPNDEIYELRKTIINLSEIQSEISKMSVKIKSIKNSIKIIEQQPNSFHNDNQYIMLSNYLVKFDLMKKQELILSEKLRSSEKLETNNYVKNAYDFLIKNNLLNIISIQNILCTKNLSKFLLSKLYSIKGLTIDEKENRRLFGKMSCEKNNCIVNERFYDNNDFNDLRKFNKYFNLGNAYICV
jgi:hypothetical protein